MDSFNKDIVDKGELDSIIDKLSKIFEDFYAFYETSKNPPSYNNYQNKVNIKEEFEKMKKAENRSFYSFYQDLSKLIGKLNDGHTHINFQNIHNSKYFFNYTHEIVSPIDLYIKNVNNETTKMFGKLHLDQNLYKYFINNETVLKVIQDNLDVPIKSINSKDPFEYIEDFGSGYLNLRNPHGTFTLLFNLFNRASLSTLPLSIEKLTGFTVVYENDQTFTTDFIITYSKKIEQDISVIEAGLDLNNINKEINYLYAPEINELPYELLNITEYDMENNMPQFSLGVQDSPTNDNNAKIKWKYNFENIFKCGIYKDTNIYFIKSFMTNNMNKFITKLVKCAEYFDKNTNPIFLITSMNGGGLGVMSKYLIEMLSPHSSSLFYNRIRRTKAFVDHDKSIYFTTDKCKLVSSIDYLTNTFMAKYNENLNDSLTDLTLVADGAIRSQLDDYKFNLKNPRKPTDIVVFTDGFSFSATSIFLKFLQYSGGGITVGYFGNPQKRENVTFDSSLSPSAIISTEKLNEYSPEFKDLNDKYNVKMQFAYLQSFYDYSSPSTFPLEYEITPVDEKIPLYENFNESLNLDAFVNFGKNFIEKYKTKCNPKNKKLYLLDEKCQFSDKHMHGGHLCGTDGIWNLSECVPTYCDINYIFNHTSQKCVFNYCSIPPYNALIIIENTAFSLSILILIGTFIYLTWSRKKQKLKIGKNDLLSEGNDELLN